MSPVNPMIVEVLGWAATAVFVGSYFFPNPDLLTRVQMVGALMWVAYGLLMRAPPVIVANVLVLSAAAWKTIQARRRAGGSAGAARLPSPGAGEPLGS